MVSFKELYNILPIRYNNRELDVINTNNLNDYIEIITSDFYNEFLDYDFRKDINKKILYNTLDNSVKLYKIKSDNVIDIRMLLKDTDTHKIVGGCSVIRKDKTSGILELAYFILPVYQGHNEAFKMLSKLLEVLEESSIDFKYTSAVVQDINVRSINLLEKLDFYVCDNIKGRHTLNKVYYRERK